MGEGAWLVAFLVAQRLLELGYAHLNTMQLRARGGVEFGAAHYPVIIVLHASWILGLWILGRDRPIIGFWLAVFVILQACRSVGHRQPWPPMDHARDHFAGCRRG